MFVITVIRYNRENYPNILSFGTKKMGHYFVRYKREFVTTVILLTEFDCMLSIKLFVMFNKKF